MATRANMPAAAYRLARRAVDLLPPAVYRPLVTQVRNRRSTERTRQVLSLAPVTAWHVPVCAICGGIDTARHTTVHGFSIVRCKQDGLLYVAPRPADLSPYYAAFYYNGGAPVVYGDYAEHVGKSMLPVWTERLRVLADLCGGRGMLLDVGAASGEFLALARNTGWRVQGIEISEWAVVEAQKRFGLSLLQGSLPDPRVPQHAFDAITMWDCIEHLSDPRATLLAIRQALKPGGVLALSTGAVPHQDPRLTSGWYAPPWHLYYFSPETISLLLRECGFAGLGESTFEGDGSPNEVMVLHATGAEPEPTVTSDLQQVSQR